MARYGKMLKKNIFLKVNILFFGLFIHNISIVSHYHLIKKNPTTYVQGKLSLGINN
jgi:hypothetical protein